jgi:putative oxidoreductase
MNTGLLILRMVFGLLFAAHGSQKLFGWFGGFGLTGTGAFFASLGFRPGRLFAAVDGGAEFISGALLTFGLFGPAVAAVMISVMIVAIATVHWRNGLLATSNGIELPLLYAAVAFALALTGPGEYSLDAMLGLRSWWTPELTAIVLTAGIAGGFASLAARQTSDPAVTHA